MSNEDLFTKQEEKKITTVSLKTDTIDRLNDYVKAKKIEGFKVNKSVIVEKAINNLLDQLEQEKSGLFGGV